MTEKGKLISDGFLVFMKESPKQARAWAEAVRALTDASVLDTKTHALAYLAVLAALRLENGVPFHVAHAKELGASRDEVISAMLVGLPAAGNVVTQSLPAAIRAYDEG